MSVWPKPFDHGQQSAFGVDYLYRGFEDPSDRGDHLRLMVRGGPLLLGFVIPPFQRAVVWDEARMASFVESLVLGIAPGTYTFNRQMERTRKDAEGEYFPHDRWLLDGQQRLTALSRFWNDEFPVFGHYWSQVPRPDQRRLLNMPFPAFQTRFTDEAAMRELYDRMNFGGIAHEEHERAFRGRDKRP